MPDLQTPFFRVSYPNVFTPKLNKLSNKIEFSVVALFPKDADLSKLKAAAQQALVEKFGADQKKWPKNLRSPFRKHEEKIIENDDGSKVFPPGMEAGGTFLTLKSNEKNPPGVIGPDCMTEILESDLYAGCWARAIVGVYAYSHVSGTAGVNFGLRHIQKAKEGDPLGSKTRVEDAFTAIEGSDVQTKDASSMFND